MLLLLTGGVYFEVSARENHEGVHAAFLHLCQEVGLLFLLVQNARIWLSYQCILSPTNYVGLSAFCENGFHFPSMPVNTENTEKPRMSFWPTKDHKKAHNRLVCIFVFSSGVIFAQVVCFILGMFRLSASFCGAAESRFPNAGLLNHCVNLQFSVAFWVFQVIVLVFNSSFH